MLLNAFFDAVICLTEERVPARPRPRMPQGHRAPQPVGLREKRRVDQEGKLTMTMSHARSLAVGPRQLGASGGQSKASASRDDRWVAPLR